MAGYPLEFVWTGAAMEPLRPHAARAAERYTIGEVYTLAPVDVRSGRSHRHYFAAIREAWLHLPADLAASYPTPEHLRKRALIQTGYRHERMYVCDLPSEAQRLAALVGPLDEFAVVVCSGCVVRVWTAKSQSIPAMEPDVFQASKADVLGFVSDLIGVTPEDLKRNTGQAA